MTSHPSTLTRNPIQKKLQFASTLKPVFLVLMVAARIANAQVTIDFENQQDMAVIGNQYSSLGVTFSGGPAILTAGVSLDESDFPPHSGTNVLTDLNGPIFGTFNSPMDLIGAYFAYTEPVTLSVFDASGDLLASANSVNSENYTSSGVGSPNEFIGISLPSGFSSFEIEGDPNGGSLVLDDLSFSPETGSMPTVPESASVSPIIAVLIMVFALDWFARNRLGRTPIEWKTT